MDSDSSGKKHIVLVEDEATIVHLIEMKLSAAGFEVDTAKDGGEGLTLIRSAKPDLVLLDMMLPTMNGFDILEALSREGILPKLPIVVISNSGQPVEVERARKLGVRDYLIKVNFSPEEVLAKVKSVLGGEERGAGGTPRTNPQDPAVLIVEDDAILVDLLEKRFLQEHYRVFKAYHAEDARKILKENPVDAILLDMVLPDIDGFTFLGELKSGEAFRNIPVLIISNLGQKEEIEKGLKAGAVDYLIKANVLPSDIVAKVGVVLRNPKPKI